MHTHARTHTRTHTHTHINSGISQLERHVKGPRNKKKAPMPKQKQFNVVRNVETLGPQNQDTNAEILSTKYNYLFKSVEEDNLRFHAMFSDSKIAKEKVPSK